MLAKVHSFSFHGITGHDIEIEVDISNGIPAFEIVGLADTAVKESKERVRSAIRNIGFKFPIMRVTVSLAPAFVRKEGSAFDLPIAVGILLATGQIEIPAPDSIGFIGELALDGGLRRVNGTLPMSIRARESGFDALVVPDGNALEAAVVEGLAVYPARGLGQIARHFAAGGGRGDLDVSVSGDGVSGLLGGVSGDGGDAAGELKRVEIDARGILREGPAPRYDFADVRGQEQAKRALEIAAAGGHHCIMVGPPGSGKTMLAKRLPSILPSLTYDEAVEITMIHSVAGMLPSGVSLISERPFRNPLTSASAASLTGGGSYPKPGEISLAHNGVLFLDELPEFDVRALDTLRQPLEDGVVTVSRVASKTTYPARATFICATNPCKCGYYRDQRRQCTCTPAQIRQYVGRISGPLLDRIDIQIEVRLPGYDALYRKGRPGESSAVIRERVERARNIQKARYAGYKLYSNAQLEGPLLERFCGIGDGARGLLRGAYEKMALSARAHDRILKVARTIADLEGAPDIGERHVAEAIGYRNFDRGGWV